MWRQILKTSNVRNPSWHGGFFKWFHGCLIMYRDSYSSVSILHARVPQGSVLGTVLFFSE